MADGTTFKPTHKPIKEYYAELEGYGAHDVKHETAVRSAFQNLLAAGAKKQGWHLVPEQSTKVKGKNIRPDGTLRDDFNLHRGYWEAKDTGDKLDAEIRKKIKQGYPLSNTIFEDTQTAVLFQNGKEVEPRFDLREPQQLCDLLNRFYSHAEPDIQGFEQAINEFKERVPELALALKKKIVAAHKSNKEFQAAFDDFMEICRHSLNPNLSEAAVDEMLIQHLLTERLFRRIFDRQDFVRRNVIASEVEKVIDALTSKAFSRHDFLKSLDRFYVAIEMAAANLEDFSEKQHFLNTVYERFFQGYSVKVADTHGIVYTPQEIVDFMCASVGEVLEKEFGTRLGGPDVNILDPCTGTGNFIVNIINRIPKRDLKRMYAAQLFANEVMLLPYYIAALNIENAYYERTGEYEPFEGLCFVDTLDLAESKQASFGFMTEENTARVERQKNAPITVIIGNPPYNMNQQNENDNNRNRSYGVVDSTIRRTYAKDSKASLHSKLYDPYVKFFRWATDRLQDRDGVVCFVSNNGFIDQVAFDGMRKHLQQDYSKILVFDLKGNVRKDSMRDGVPIGEEHTVFGLAAMVGISLTLLVKKGKSAAHELHYADVDWSATRREKFAILEGAKTGSQVLWKQIEPDKQGNWLQSEHSDEFKKYLPIGTKEAKEFDGDRKDTIFGLFSLGVGTNRDQWAYDYVRHRLSEKMQMFIKNYNYEVFRYSQEKTLPKNVDDFVNNDAKQIKWTDRLKKALVQGEILEFQSDSIRKALYRPFTKTHLYFDNLLNQRRYQQHRILPTRDKHEENQALAVGGYGRKQFAVLAAKDIPDLNFYADPGQCFPFYTYNEDGTNRRENITDWALEKFRTEYGNKRISKWDIFYYVYGLLHHPSYRERFADNLKRELPRIPFAPDFKAFSKAGKKLAELHLGYEDLEEWPLTWIDNEEEPLSYHVEKMKLSKDKTQLKVNESLTLGKIPPEVFEYRLGNRSALDWVIDQYRIKTDKRSCITSDPNNPDDEEYIVRLVGQVVRVSVETVKIVDGLPEGYGAEKAADKKTKPKRKKAKKKD